jgi:sensor histidine kinase YesM
MDFKNKNKLYWLCQFGGWSLFTTLELISYTLIDGFHPLLLLNGVINVIIGVAITHTYRLFLIRSAWLNLRTTKLIPRVAIAVIIMSVLMAAVNIPLDRITYPIFTRIELNSAILFSYLFNWSKYILLWSLIYHLFQYWEKSLQAEKEKYQLAAAMRDSAFNNLVAQLNPHFLFNSLNSIRTLVILDPQQAQHAVTLLSELLRRTLKYGKEKLIPLQEELSLVDNYLQIEQIRFEDRLIIEKYIDETSLQIKLPPFVVQTLIENAVKHGIAKLISGGRIVLRITQEQQTLIISIVNTGTLADSNSDGVGLVNARERLALLFGQNAQLKLSQMNNHEVEARIELKV